MLTASLGPFELKTMRARQQQYRPLGTRPFFRSSGEAFTNGAEKCIYRLDMQLFQQDGAIALML